MIGLCELGQVESTSGAHTSSGYVDTSLLSLQGCRPERGGGWCTPDMPPSGAPGEWAAGLPEDATGAVGSLFRNVYRSQYLGCSWSARVPSSDGKPRTTCHSRLRLTRTENKEQHLHHLTSDMKGIISVALNVLSDIILCYKIVSTVC